MNAFSENNKKDKKEKGNKKATHCLRHESRQQYKQYKRTVVVVALQCGRYREGQRMGFSTCGRFLAFHRAGYQVTRIRLCPMTSCGFGLRLPGDKRGKQFFFLSFAWMGVYSVPIQHGTTPRIQPVPTLSKETGAKTSEPWFGLAAFHSLPDHSSFFLILIFYF